MLNNPTEYALMAQVEKDHWWYRVLHERSISSLTPSPSPEGRGGLQILDAGCGTGGLMLKLKEAGYTNVLGADLSETALEICRQRGLDVIQSNIAELANKIVGESFDVIFCNDVLCYFTMEQVTEIVKGFYQLLKPGGLLIMNNPGHAAFAGEHDKAVGIVTRFNPDALSRTIHNAQFTIHSFTQWPFLLSPAIYLTRKFRRGAKSDVSMPSAFVNAMLYCICKLEMAIFKRAPWGSSVFIVARKD